MGTGFEPILFCGEYIIFRKCKHCLLLRNKGGVDVNVVANYRPVSCLPAATKLLETVVFEQVSDYLEKTIYYQTISMDSDQESTIIAWTNNMQQEWALNSENEEITGVLLWRLSADFDTLMKKTTLFKCKFILHKTE